MVATPFPAAAAIPSQPINTAANNQQPVQYLSFYEEKKGTATFRRDPDTDFTLDGAREGGSAALSRAQLAGCYDRPQSPTPSVFTRRSSIACSYRQKPPATLAQSKPRWDRMRQAM